MKRIWAHRPVRLAVGGQAFGPVPAGGVGRVVRHNLAAGVDATALFYTEYEGTPEAEAAMRRMRGLEVNRTGFSQAPSVIHPVKEFQ